MPSCEGGQHPDLDLDKEVELIKAKALLKASMDLTTKNSSSFEGLGAEKVG